MAPKVAPITAAAAPVKMPNRKPPLTVRNAAPGSDSATAPDIDADIGEHGQHPVLRHEDVDGRAVAHQRLERDRAASENEKGGNARAARSRPKG